MVSSVGGRSAEFKRPSLKGSFFPGKRTDRVTPVFRDLCAGNYLPRLPPPETIETPSDRVTLLVFTISEDIILLRRRHKFFPRSFEFTRFENTNSKSDIVRHERGAYR